MRRFVPLLAALVGVLSAPAVATAAPQSGVNITLNQASDQTFAKIASSGAKWVRYFHQWNEGEPVAGQVNSLLLRQLRDINVKAHAHGLKVNAVVLGAPGWANGGQDAYHPPLRAETYGAYVRTFVGTMGGTLDSLEVWNEPDGEEFWRAEGDHAPAYTALLRSAYSAAKAADPRIRVLMGGVTGTNWRFLQDVYANGGGGSFDAVAAHPDTACLVASPYEYLRDGATGRISPFNFLGYRAMHDVMAENGDGHKPIVLSEVGWSTAKGTCERGAWAGKKPRGVSEADQALFLKQAWHCISETPYVEGGWWFNFQDAAGEADQGELLHYGLLRFNGSEKPAWAALRAVSGGAGHGQEGPCGDFVSPTLHVDGPAEELVFADSLPIEVRASDSTGVASIRLTYDGDKKIRSFTAPDPAKLPKSLSGTIDWQGARHLPLGRHVLEVRASDKQGNVTRKDVVVTKVAPGALPRVRTTTSLAVKRLGGLRVRATGRVKATGPVSRMVGKLQITFLKYDARKRRWKPVHKHLKPAKVGSVRINQRLFSKGTWKVQATYLAQAPLVGSKRTSGSLRIR